MNGAARSFAPRSATAQPIRAAAPVTAPPLPAKSMKLRGAAAIVLLPKAGRRAV
jgi:hypothetical protein